MKINIRNKGTQRIAYLMRCEGEKIGYIYYLAPGEELQCYGLHTHKDGLVCESIYNSVYSISYSDFQDLEITYTLR